MSNIKYHLAKNFKHKLAVWEITLKCNSNCIHCGSSAGKSRSDELNTKEALKLVGDLKSCGYDGIAIMGGEPFLRKDWYEIAEEIKKLKLKLSIISNGLDLPKRIELLKKLRPDCVSLSLDGGSFEIHDYIRGVKGAFDKVFASIRSLKKVDLPISIITTVNTINLKELKKIRSLLLNREIPWQIQIALPIGRFPKELVISKEQFYGVAMFIASSFKKYSAKELPIIGAHCFGYFSNLLPNLGLDPWFGCQAGRSVLGIQSNGNIKGCLTLPDDFVVSNIRKDDLKDILNSDLNNKTNEFINNTIANSYCGDCRMFNRCKGGCLGTAISLESYENPYCLRAIEQNMYKKNKLPFRWKMDSKISSFKYLYNKISRK